MTTRRTLTTSMHPRDCPEFEYDNHPQRTTVLPSRCEELLRQLYAKTIPADEMACDTRPSHRHLFEKLTPPRHSYYAGNYRGAAYRCLREYEVGVLQDPRVGIPPGRVSGEMTKLASEIRLDLGVLSQVHNLPNSQCSGAMKVMSTIVVACRVLEQFLRVHPYANGNGHAGRFVVWAILWRCGYWPQKWPLDASPPYHVLLSRYRDGDVLPLEQFVLSCL